MKKAFIINAFQRYEGLSKGELNKSIERVIEEEMRFRNYDIMTTNLEQGYSINEEVDKHLQADVIFLQSPVYWFGSPWIYKKYVDEVFTAGLLQGSFLENDGRSHADPRRQYGSGGKLRGKQYMLSLTWNAPKQAFEDKSQYLFEGKSVDDVWIANTANYRFCGVEILPSFSCFNVVKEPDIAEDITRLRAHLKQLFTYFSEE